MSHSEKGILVGDKQNLAYLFSWNKAIKRVRSVKFTDSYGNSLLPEPCEDEQMVLSDYISNIYLEKRKDKQNTKEEQMSLSNKTEKTRFLLLLLLILNLVGWTTVI